MESRALIDSRLAFANDPLALLAVDAGTYRGAGLPNVVFTSIEDLVGAPTAAESTAAARTGSRASIPRTSTHAAWSS